MSEALHSKIRLAVTSWLAGALLAAPGALAEPVGCDACHAPATADLSQSVHDELRCQECHQGPVGYELSADELSRFRSGQQPAFDHGRGFVGVPPRTEVPRFCGECHEDVLRMNPYGLRTDPLARYWTSNHGQRILENDTKAAVCTDCHGSHLVLSESDPKSRTHPLNVPDTCGTCHANAALVEQYGLSSEVVTEYRQSIHGHLLYELHDTGAPTCATCHDNHAAVPPGFASVGHVCGKCHTASAEHFHTSVHAGLEGFKQCIQCHGGGPDRHSHLIEKITKPAGVLVQRYAHLLRVTPQPTPEQITAAIHADPKEIIARVLPSCQDCHEPVDDPESSLHQLFGLLEEIAKAERTYVQTAQRLEEMSRGVLLLERQRFEFQDAKTHLVALAPLQHTLDLDAVRETVKELEEVCAEVNLELDESQTGLRYRRLSLIPIFAFALLFSALLYAKFRVLKHRYVKM